MLVFRAISGAGAAAPLAVSQLLIDPRDVLPHTRTLADSKPR